jgi:transcriptional regulator with XRE-family HTH domain
MSRTITGLRIRERRRELGIKQVDLADRVGISPSYMNLIERNKRGISGALLSSIGRELSLTIDQLDGSAERRLHDELTELATDPELRDPEMNLAAVDELIARFPGWAKGAVKARGKLREAWAENDAMSDRLTHDPALAEAIHSMLTEITALRSTAEILASTEDLEPDQRARFLSIILEQSKRLSDTGGSLAAYFDRIVDDRRRPPPIVEVEEFLERRAGLGNVVEAVADRLRARLCPDGEDVGMALHGMLPNRGPNTLARNARNERLTALSRQAVHHFRPAEIDALLDELPPEFGVDGRALAEEELIRLCADALRRPGYGFVALGTGVNWDIEDLVRALDDDSGLTFRRIATLSEFGAPRAAHVEIDAAGRVLHRRGALDLLPRAREFECPLWPAHEADARTGAVIARMVTLPDGGERLVLAMGRRREKRADMLVMNRNDAQDTVYRYLMYGATTPVGSACRICAHRECGWRREEPIIDL